MDMNQDVSRIKSLVKLPEKEKRREKHIKHYSYFPITNILEMFCFATVYKEVVLIRNAQGLKRSSFIRISH